MKIRQKSLFLITAIFSLIIILVNVVYYLTIGKDLAQKKLRSPASLVIQRKVIMAFGRLEPAGEILSIAGPTGERIARLQVKEGDWVKTGEILAYLETYAVQKHQRNLAASQVMEIQAQISTDTLAAKTQIKQSDAQLRQIDQPGILQIRSQKALLRSDQAELVSVTRTRDRYRQLYAEGGISRQSLEDKELIVRQNEEKVNQARETLKQLVKLHSENLRKAKVDLRYSQVNLERINSHSGLASAIQKLKLAEVQLEQTIIRAPSAGKILKILTHPGEAILQQGILQMGDTSTMYAVAEVYETDIRLIKLGQSAIITSPAFSRPMRGKVAQIGQFIFKNDILSDDPAASSDARVVEVRIKLEQSQLVASLSKLEVDVQIDLTADKTKYVP